jgi:DNA-binding MarR family transcriptional regulator
VTTIKYVENDGRDLKNLTTIKILLCIKNLLDNNEKCLPVNISKKTLITYSYTIGIIKYLKYKGYITISRVGRCSHITLTTKGLLFINKIMELIRIEEGV